MSNNPSDDDVREGVKRAESGAPAAGKAVRDRFTVDEIFQRIVASADEEVAASSRELFLSGLAAGFAITLTFLGHAVGAASSANDVIAAVLYPVGFVYIIVGRYQLYTENTLPPVALVLTRLASLPLLLRIWGVVLLGNIVGAGLGALVLAKTGVLSPETAQAAAEFGKKGLKTGWWALFFKAIFAGWLVAGVVWLNHAARDTISRVVLVYFVFFTISAANLYHVVVAICDALYLVFTGSGGVIDLITAFWLPVLLGNTIGGVVLVALVNYGQTQKHRVAEQEMQAELSVREWIFGGYAGRDRVSTADMTETDRR